MQSACPEGRSVLLLRLLASTYNSASDFISSELSSMSCSLRTLPERCSVTIISSVVAMTCGHSDRSAKSFCILTQLMEQKSTNFVLVTKGQQELTFPSLHVTLTGHYTSWLHTLSRRTRPFDRNEKYGFIIFVWITLNTSLQKPSVNGIQYNLSVGPEQL